MALPRRTALAARLLRRMTIPARLLAAVAVLALVVRQVGGEPFRVGLRAVSVPAVAAVLGIAAVTTLCSAWRWCVVARALGAPVPLRSAVGAYYRSQLLNSMLPTGVVGDVHRGVTHGRRAGAVGRGLATVGWERACGQAVQVALTVGLLLVLPSPARPAMPVIAATAAATVLLGIFLRRAWRRNRACPAPPGISRSATVLRAARADAHRLLAPQVWPTVLLASLLAFAGHGAVFLIAARSVGSAAPIGTLVALGLLILAAMSVPLSLGGWGPREGVALWAFGAAGFGGAAGVAVTTVYGVLSLAGVLPGAALLAADAVRSRRGRESRTVGTEGSEGADCTESTESTEGTADGAEAVRPGTMRQLRSEVGHG